MGAEGESFENKGAVRPLYLSWLKHMEPVCWRASTQVSDQPDSGL